jgi:hypothetical protein
LLLFLLAMSAGPTRVQAQVVVRGRIDRQLSLQAPQIYPAAGTAITLTIPATGATSLPSYVGPDGMYYVYGVPPGPYLLRVWLPGFNVPLATQPIQVILQQTGVFDIPPIRVVY